MRIGIDIGGTFTDFVLFEEDSGELTTYKLPSTPSNPAEAVLEGLRMLDPGPRPYIIHGSTVATNALLEWKGAYTGDRSAGHSRECQSPCSRRRGECGNFTAHWRRPSGCACKSGPGQGSRCQPGDDEQPFHWRMGPEAQSALCLL
jgi:hypothetical protein